MNVPIQSAFCILHYAKLLILEFYYSSHSNNRGIEGHVQGGVYKYHNYRLTLGMTSKGMTSKEHFYPEPV